VAFAPTARASAMRMVASKRFGGETRGGGGGGGGEGGGGGGGGGGSGGGNANGVREGLSGGCLELCE